jgi:parallel beta-helix repeat protein
MVFSEAQQKGGVFAFTFSAGSTREDTESFQRSIRRTQKKYILRRGVSALGGFRLIGLRISKCISGFIFLLLFASVISILPDCGDASSHTIHSPIRINGNAGFTSANGVVSGSGTASDPYIIEDWDIDAGSDRGISVRSTDAHFIIRNTSIYTTSMPLGNAGITLSNVTNCEIINTTITGVFRGIEVFGGSNLSFAGNLMSAIPSNGNAILFWPSHTTDNTSISDNILRDCGRGVELYDAMSIEVSGNYLECPLMLDDCTSVYVHSNRFSGSGLNVVGQDLREYVTHTITADNLVNGRPLLYFKNLTDVTLDTPNAGQVIVTDCENFNMASFSTGNTYTGIRLAFVSHALLVNCSVTSSREGIAVDNSSHVVMKNCSLVGNQYGARFSGCTDCLVTENRFTANPYTGLQLGGCSGTTVYHNDFLNNSYMQARENNGDLDSWDGGYIAGGNYWSDYPGRDLYSGPEQDLPGPDGFGDSPYEISPGAVIPEAEVVSGFDHYPLIAPWHIQGRPIAAFTVTPVEGRVSTTFRFNASFSTAAENSSGALQVRWDWENDGVWDTEWSNDLTVEHIFSRPGKYTVVLEIRDSLGLVGFASMVVQVSTHSIEILWIPIGILSAALIAFGVLYFWSLRAKNRRRN